MRSDRQFLKYMLSLIEKLKQVKDFRKDKGKRHPLWIVLLVIILGTMLGYSGSISFMQVSNYTYP